MDFLFRNISSIITGLKSAKAPAFDSFLNSAGAAISNIIMPLYQASVILIGTTAISLNATVLNPAVQYLKTSFNRYRLNNLAPGIRTLAYKVTTAKPSRTNDSEQKTKSVLTGLGDDSKGLSRSTGSYIVTLMLVVIGVVISTLAIRCFCNYLDRENRQQLRLHQIRRLARMERQARRELELQELQRAQSDLRFAIQDQVQERVLATDPDLLRRLLQERLQADQNVVNPQQQPALQHIVRELIEENARQNREREFVNPLGGYGGPPERYVGGGISLRRIYWLMNGGAIRALRPGIRLPPIRLRRVHFLHTAMTSFVRERQDPQMPRNEMPRDALVSILQYANIR